MEIDILLATYNGEKYLQEQLESLCSQTEKDFQLIIGDDNSSDNTLKIIDTFKPRFKKPPIVIKRQERTGSAKNNFSDLLRYSSGNYIFFCDQDDIWHKNKIKRSLMEIKRSEEIHGKEIPILFHSDLCVANESGTIIENSYWSFKNIKPENSLHLNRTITYATVTGCTMCINRVLKEAICEIPSCAYMHDWWIAQVASAIGLTIYTNEQLIDYRIHQNNSSRPEKQRWYKIKNNLHRAKLLKEGAKSKYIVARELHSQYGSRLDKDKLRILEGFISMENAPFLLRQYRAMKYNFFDKKDWRSIPKLLSI